jgi:hypothetical protein
MAEVAPDHSASKRTVDDLFQILIARDVPPLIGKKQITEALQLGKLRIDFHIAAGARKTRPMRQATPEELKALSDADRSRRRGVRRGRRPKALQARKDLDFLYEASPAGGITAAVDPQSWDAPRVFALAIRDGHLLVEPQCSLDFPWQAYSFSISNPVVIDELWPPAASDPTPSGPTGDEERPPADVDKITQLEWAYGRLFETNQLIGLRGKALLNAVCAKVAPKFSASQRYLQEAIKRYRGKHPG